MSWTTEIPEDGAYVKTTEGNYVNISDEQLTNPSGSSGWEVNIQAPSGGDSSSTGTVSESDNGDGTSTYKIIGTGSLDVEFMFPEDYDGVSMVIYPIEYLSASFIYETFAGDSFDEPWSNTEQVEGFPYSDEPVSPVLSLPWEHVVEDGDMLDISVISGDQLVLSFSVSGDGVAAYYRYLPIPEDLTFADLWVGVSGTCGTWEHLKALNLETGESYIWDAYFSLVFFSNDYDDGRCAAFNLKRLLEIAEAGEDITEDITGNGQTEFEEHNGFFGEGGVCYIRLARYYYNPSEEEYMTEMPDSRTSGDDRLLITWRDSAYKDSEVPLVLTDSVDHAVLLVEAGNWDNS